MNDVIYMDYNATAPMRPEVIDIINDIIRAPHNASSVHSLGREGRKQVEKARAHVAALVNAPTAQVIFNSGATESNNTVLQYFKDERVLVSAIEHPSVPEALPESEHIPVTADGTVDLNALEDLLKQKKTALVSVMLVNNETGVIQPIPEISALAKKHGALVHCDAVQAAGRIHVDINTLGVDFLTLSSHKLGGPQGTGALILGLCGITPTLLHGGGQEKKGRAGTENVAGIAGFGKAAELALAQIEEYQKLAVLRDILEDKLQALDANIKIYGQNAPRVANTCMFSLPDMRAEAALMALDLDGIAVSNGSACSSGTVHSSHVLKAMGADEKEAASALRVSLGWNTQGTDIERFIACFSKIHERTSQKQST